MADDIAQWLEGLGVGQYAQAFADNDIDLKILPHLSDDDLRDLGLSLGHRRTIQVALADRVDSDAPSGSETSQETQSATSAQAERRQLTVMFCDLVGSTALSEKLDPEDIRDVMRGYQGACASVVERYGGYVAKFMGDGVYCYFGYPRAHEDDAERAIYAGLGIVDAVGRLGRNLSVRVGIATGIVVVGDLIGEGAAEEAAITGETPNLAARLQEHAAPDSVVIAERTRQLAGQIFEYRNFGALTLKGFAEPLQACAVVRARRAESRFDAVRAGALTDLVGREDEIEILTRRWARAKNGEGQVMLIAGEPGIGKSRITRELQERIADDPHVPLLFQCSPFHTNSAFHPLIDNLERTAGFEPGDDAAAKLDKLEAWIKLSDAPVETTAPLFASLLSLQTGERYPPLALSPEQQKERILRHLTERLTHIAAERPAHMEDANA